MVASRILWPFQLALAVLAVDNDGKHSVQQNLLQTQGENPSEKEPDWNSDQHAGKEGMGPPVQPAVVELTSHNFNDTIGKGKVVVVDFFVPWCDHSVALEPEWEKVAQWAKKRAPDVVVAKVDIESYQDLGNWFKIKSSPTILWFRPDGDAYHWDRLFKGERSAQYLIYWIKESLWKMDPDRFNIADVDSYQDATKDYGMKAMDTMTLAGSAGSASASMDTASTDMEKETTNLLQKAAAANPESCDLTAGFHRH